MPIERRSTTLPATGRTLSGYALRWDDVAAVAEDGERFDERAARGAFARSLANGPPIVLFAHGRSALGQLPVGRIVSIREDDIGLALEVELYDEPMFVPVLDAVQAGGLRSLSIGFRVVDESWDRTRRPPLRTLREVDLIEVSIVPRGAYPQAKAGVRLAELMEERARLAAAIARGELAEEIRAEHDARRHRLGVQLRAEMLERARQQRLRKARQIIIDRHRRQS